MANTTRTRDQLFALFPDNTTRQISPQRDRDFIASAFPFLSLVDPSPNNDRADTAGIGAFFDFGSHWLNLNTGEVWYCLDGQATAAVWSGPPAPPAAVPIPASLSLDGSTQYLSYNGTSFQTSSGAAFSVNVWCKVASSGPYQFIWWSYDPISGQGVSVFLASGYVWFSGGTAFGAADVAVAWPGDGQWHMVTAGYSAATGSAFIIVDADDTSASVPTTTLVGITGTTVAVGAQDLISSVVNYVDGELDELAFFGELTGDDLAALFNNGDGLYYRQAPCDLFHRVVFWWPFDEPSGDRVDLVTGLILLPIGNPPSGDPICGWRFELISVAQAANTFLAGPVSGSPAAAVYRLFDPLDFVSLGSAWLPITALTGPGTLDPTLLPGSPAGPIAGWRKDIVTYLDFAGTGNTLVLLDTLPPGMCYGRSMNINTVPWTQSLGGQPTAIGIYADADFSKQMNAIGDAGRIGSTETKIRFDGTTEQTAFTNQHPDVSTDIYLGITRGILTGTTTAGACIFWTEILYLT